MIKKKELRSISKSTCPKCKKSDISSISEGAEGTFLTYSLDDKGNIVSSIVGDVSGNRIYTATCKCGHFWKIRNTKSGIIEIEHFEDNWKNVNGWRELPDDKKLYK